MLPDKLNFVMPFIKAMSSKIYRQANVSATNACSYVDYFDQEFGISRDKVFYLHNMPRIHTWTWTLQPFLRTRCGS